MFSTTQLPGMAASTKQVAIAYGVFLASAGAVYFGVADREFASIQTMAGMSQCLAMILLAMQIRGGSIEGVSLNALVLHAAALACRLSSTTWLNGYLPVDASGDWIYQAFDVIALVIAARLVAHLTAREPSGSALARREIVSAVPVLFIALAMAALLHANMDKRPLFDILWMAGVFLASAAMVPQLLALRALPPKANPLAGHALSVMTMAQVLSAIYMWHARNDMTCDPWFEGFNHSPWAVLTAHVLPLLITCDFSQDWSGLA